MYKITLVVSWHQQSRYCIYITSRHAAKYLSVTRAWELFPFYELLKKMGLNYEKVSYSQWERMMEPKHVLFIYLLVFWISSISVVKATLRSALCASLWSILCIVFNSSWLAFLNKPRSTCCTSSSTERWPPMNKLPGSCVKRLMSIFSVIFVRQQLDPNGGCLASLVFLKLTSLWFQYSTQRWSGSRASIAWK